MECDKYIRFSRMDSDLEHFMEEEEEEEVEEAEEEDEAEEVEEAEEEALWSETETLLHTISMLQEEAIRRTEGVLLRIQSNWVKECYLASLEDLEKTGEVTFGQHLLRRYRNNN